MRPPSTTKYSNLMTARCSSFSLVNSAWLELHSAPALAAAVMYSLTRSSYACLRLCISLVKNDVDVRRKKNFGWRRQKDHVGCLPHPWRRALSQARVTVSPSVNGPYLVLWVHRRDSPNKFGFHAVHFFLPLALHGLSYRGSVFTAGRMWTFLGTVGGGEK